MRPRLILWIGIALVAAGGVLSTLLRTLPVLSALRGPAQSQAELIALDTVSRAFELIAVPFGAVLIGAALVMFHIDRRLRPKPDDFAVWKDELGELGDLDQT